MILVVQCSLILYQLRWLKNQGLAGATGATVSVSSSL